MIASAGLEVNDDTIATSKWMLENDIPLTKENLTYAQALRQTGLTTGAEDIAALAAEAVSEGKSAQDADPSDLGGRQHGAQAKIHAYCNGDGQQREDELAERQPEKQALLIVSDLFVDAYLDWISPPFPFLDFWQTGVAMSAGVC